MFFFIKGVIRNVIAMDVGWEVCWIGNINIWVGLLWVMWFFEIGNNLIKF